MGTWRLAMICQIRIKRKFEDIYEGGVMAFTCVQALQHQEFLLQGSQSLPPFNPAQDLTMPSGVEAKTWI